MKRLWISVFLTVLILGWAYSFYCPEGLASFDWKVFVIFASLGFLAMYKLVGYLAQFKIIEHNSRIDIVFVVCVVAFLYFPASNISHETVSVQENRNLAVYKPLVDGGKINYNFGRDFESWFNDHFNSRDFFIDLNSKLSRLLDRKLKNATAMAGKDNWLFTKRWNSVETFQNKNLYSDEELLEIKENLEAVNKWAAKNNIKFYVMINPDKERVYPEFYPEEFKPVRDLSRIEQVAQYIKNNVNVPLVFVYDELLKAKKDHILYYKTGTHWNHRGAFVAYTQLMNRIKQDFPSLYVMKEKDFNIKPVLEADVDIASALGVNAYNTFPKEDLTYDKFEVKNPHTSSKHTFLDEERRIETYDYVNTDKSKKLRGVIYGDSFVLRMNWYMAESFARFQHIYTGYGRMFDVSFMAEDIKQIKPDIFVIQTTERLLDRLKQLNAPED